MSKVGEYYRELSEFMFPPRSVRKKPVKKKDKKKNAEKSEDKSA